MTCAICGSENKVKWCARFRYMACKACAAETPAKVSFETFKERYFPGEDISYCIARDFYEDYKTSTYTLSEYIEATTGCAV